MKKALTNKTFIFGGLFSLLFLILFLSYYFTYKEFALAFLPFFLTFAGLFIIFLLLDEYLKDKPAKSYKFKWLTSFSAHLAKKENRYKFYFSILSIVLIIVFFARFYFYKDTFAYSPTVGVTKWHKYYDTLHLNSLLICDGAKSFLTLNRFEMVIGTLSNDIWSGLVILSLVSAFYLKENSLFARRYIGAPLTLFVTLFFPILAKGIIGTDYSNFRIYLLGIELGILDFYYFSSVFSKEKVTFNKSSIFKLIAILIPFLFTCFSAYTPSLLFGRTALGLSNPHELSNLSHRLFVYLSFLLPILYFILLSSFSKEERIALLLQISLGALIGYVSINRYDIWQNFSTWPLHLCNTAMYTMPITLLFISYGLYYFTFFINVLGAFLALMMPNYSEALYVFSPTITGFFINHLHAFFMPVLIMLLGVYKRPKMKYFVYSQIGFLVYFALVMFVNVDLTAHGDPTDFFFINSDFVAKKLGEWAKNLFNVTLTFERNGLTYVVHYAYDIAYYLVYILLAFVMWFVYELLFRGVDELLAVRLARIKSISRHDAYLEIKEKGGLTMEKNQISLVIDHLSKRYPGADSLAVNDVSFSLLGGKIYGFLGKNGAGKSTIIKSIVGIHGFDKGYISVCGHDVNEEPLEAKREIGYVPDNYALYENLSGRQYINYIADLYKVPLDLRKQRIDDLVERLELGPRFDKLMKTYSHGMKQKITIIAALVHEPKIWILDEPMTGLDPNSIFQIKECMKEHARKGNIVFFSSHIIDVVQNICNEVIIIKKGVLVKRIDLDKEKEEREHLEETFLNLTSDSKEEITDVLNDEQASKGAL